jgi:hypothetical protein
MSKISELDILRQTLNEALDHLRDEMVKLDLPELSKTSTERHPMDIPDFLPTPRLFEARRVVLGQCLERRCSMLPIFTFCIQ